jgi:hypothetical protein
MAVDENATIDRATIDYIAENDPPTYISGISIAGTLINSTVNANTMRLAISNSVNNRLSGLSENWAISTRNKDYWIDQGTKNTTMNPVQTSTGIYSSSGALIARAQLCLSGRCLHFQVLLASTSGNLSIVANSQIVLAAPGGQAFTLADYGTCVVIDQATCACNGDAVTVSGISLVITILIALSPAPHNIIVSGTVSLT